MATYSGCEQQKQLVQCQLLSCTTSGGILANRFEGISGLNLGLISQSQDGHSSLLGTFFYIFLEFTVSLVVEQLE